MFTNKILTSQHYTNHTLEEGKVCKIDSGGHGSLNLGKDNKSAMIVQDEYYFKKWSGNHVFDCRFKVNAHFNMGVFAVIQRMTLRRDPETDTCIDFIQFRPPLNIRDKLLVKAQNFLKKTQDPWGKKYCGEVGPGDHPLPDGEESDVAMNAYIARDGELEVRIHVADRKLDPGEDLGVEIAFTSFLKDCKSSFGAYKSCGDDTCIFKEYFSDKVINCPYVSCKDEPDCAAYFMETELLEKGLNTKVYITAVSSIFLSFFLFLGCIMLCRYFDLLCWSDGGGEVGGATELEQVSPSAPSPDSPDKDLPPAYETLFPPTR